MKVLEATKKMVQALDELPELRVFDYPPDTLAPPAAIVGFPYSVDQTDQLTNRVPASDSLYRWPVPVILVLARSSEREARERFDTYQTQVVDKLMTLDRRGICHLHLTRITQIRPLQIGGGSYWACDVIMEVWA